MLRWKNFRNDLIELLAISWKKAIIVFAALSAIFSFITIFFKIAFAPWHFVVVVVVGAIISIIWARIDSAVKGTHTLDISERVGSSRSMNDIYPDRCHKFTHITRQDLLDYKTSQPGAHGRDFVSMRLLEGHNVSNNTTDGIVYLECSEYKSYCRETEILAYDMQTGKQLKVEFLGLDESKKHTDFPFKIFFQKPLKPGETFQVAFSIKLKHELDVLTDDDEIMSICLLRYKKGIERLDFNVCLDFDPQSVCVLTQRKLGGSMFEFAGGDFTIEEYIPAHQWETKFDLNWSSQPYIIRWGCDKPRQKFYLINYRR